MNSAMYATEDLLNIAEKLTQPSTQLPSLLSDDDTSCYVSDTSSESGSNFESSEDSDTLNLTTSYSLDLPESKERYKQKDDDNISVITRASLTELSLQMLSLNEVDWNRTSSDKAEVENQFKTRGLFLYSNASRLNVVEQDEWEMVGSTETRKSNCRWFVLLVICLSIFVRSFVSVVFGQINDVFSAFYNVPSGAVDWLTNSGSLATMLAVPAVAYMGKNKTSLRALCLLMTGTASIGTGLLTGAMTSRDHGFILAIAGQAIMGANNAIAMTVPPLVAATWFPEDEMATAFASALISVGAGDAIGSYLPAMLVSSPSEEVTGNSKAELQSSANVPQVQLKLVAMFACTAGLSLVTFIVSAAFLKNRPSFPPSKAQQMRRERVHDDQLSSNLKPLHKNKDFLLVTFFYGISAASAANSVTLLSSMVRDAFGRDRREGFNIDVTSGRIMTAMFICFSVGPFVAGRVIDRTKRYQLTALAGMAGLAVGNAGVSLSLMFQNVEGLYFSHAVVGCFMGISETALFEIASQVTYPHPEINFSCVLVMSWMAFFVLYPILGRLALVLVETAPTQGAINAATVASSLPTAFSIASLLLAIFFLRPTYKRQLLSRQLSNSDRKTALESTPLLSA